MTTRITWLDWVAFTLLIVGGLNWGLIGLFGFDLVASIFGPAATSIVTRVIYTLVGISALYCIFLLTMMDRSVMTTQTHLRKAA